MENELGLLRPHAHEALTLPNGTTATVRKALVPFRPWKGTPINNPYRKPLVDLDGEPMYAEVAVLRMLEAGGWRSIWVDSYGKCFRQFMPHEEPPVYESDAVGDLSNPDAFRKFGGGWDVVASKGTETVFAECKRKGKDALRPSQLKWMQDRLSEGVPESSFIVVEWTLPEEKPHRFDLREGRWYGYEMLGAYDNPYWSPIYAESVKRSGRKLAMRFWNVRYAAGVQDFTKQFRLLHETSTHLLAAIEGQPERSAIIAELKGAWPDLVIPSHFLKSHPLNDQENKSADYEAYLERMARERKL